VKPYYEAYRSFLEAKAQIGGFAGFEPIFIPEFLFDFQKDLTRWALLKGKAAIFADCGLGKTPMQLVWAENVVRKTGHPVLIITPLAVSYQTVAEGKKFGIEVQRCQDGRIDDNSGIFVTNYERLQHFDPAEFSGAVCDESSILKSFDGKRRSEITEFMRRLHYRLLCTATAAPNDYTEVGTSSEALGGLGHIDMLMTRPTSIHFSRKRKMVLRAATKRSLMPKPFYVPATPTLMAWQWPWGTGGKRSG
jgi:hypothetical protein